MTHNKTCIITGGAGFIGSHIADAMLDADWRVFIIDNLSSGKRENIPGGAQLVVRDINDAALFDIAREIRPSVIIHQAAQPSLLASVRDPAHDAEVNIIGTLSVIAAAHVCNARVLMASTSAVYAESGATVIYETDTTGPTRPYGISKLAAEMYLRNSGLSHAILRYGNVYGPRQVPVGENQLIPRALAHIYDGAEFEIYGDGSHARDFIFVGDVALANVRAAEMVNVRGTFNISTGVASSVNTVLGLIREHTGWTGAWRNGAAKANEPKSVRLSPLAAATALGWRAGVELDAGVKAAVEAWRR